MRGIPAIGGASGIFEVFVPGLFLLLNLIGVIFFLPFPQKQIEESIFKIFASPALSLVIVIGFGYLMGVLLRIFRAEAADKWSGKYLRLFDKNCRGGEKRRNLYAYQLFPYVGWLGVISQRSMSNDVLEFFYKYWANFKFTDLAIKGLKSEKTVSYTLSNKTIDRLKLTDFPEKFIPKLEKKIEHKRIGEGSFINFVEKVIGNELNKSNRNKILKASEKELIKEFPKDIINKIEFQLMEQTFKSKNTFLSAIAKVIGKNQTAKFEAELLKWGCLWGKDKDSSFFNFCKTMIISSDDKLANELYSRASLSRYISGMFYALISASWLVFGTVVLQLYLKSTINPSLVLIFFVYIVAIVGILRNLRFMRISEAQTVFYASFKNQAVFEIETSQNTE